MSRTSVLTDEQWERIRPLLPSSEGRRGRPFRDDRPVVEGILYRYRCGIAWREAEYVTLNGQRPFDPFRHKPTRRGGCYRKFTSFEFKATKISDRKWLRKYFFSR